MCQVHTVIRDASIFYVDAAYEGLVTMFSLPFCRLASTPAMFNSTLTENDAFLCPVDGSIMITGKLHMFSFC
jgi:hypothetical protein